MRTMALAVGLGGWLLVSVLAHAQGPAPQAFRVEWSRRTDPWLRPGVDGYVHNDSNYRVGNVLLRVQVVDGSERVLSERSAWVIGNIVARGRGHFSLPVLADGQTYRIAVKSWDLISIEAP